MGTYSESSNNYKIKPSYFCMNILIIIIEKAVKKKCIHYEFQDKKEENK